MIIVRRTCVPAIAPKVGLRVRFSFLSGALDLLSIAPEKKAPLQRVVIRLLGDIREQLSDCRERWWMANRTVCLTNQWALMRADGTVDFLVKRAAGPNRLSMPTMIPLGNNWWWRFETGRQQR